ncbi:MAG: hypothetical protein AAGE01_18085 [Pseudomonadota bacterium]
MSDRSPRQRLLEGAVIALVITVIVFHDAFGENFRLALGASALVVAALMAARAVRRTLHEYRRRQAENRAELERSIRERRGSDDGER